MTDDVCDSWEDVDVDKIVINSNKNNNKQITQKPTYSSILAANVTTTNDGTTKNIVNIIDSNDQIQTNGSFRILQRVSDSNLPFTNQPKIILENTRTQFVKGLRILNRPNKNNETKNESKLNDDEIQQKLKKSFAEKQAEYAKARLRILGEMMPAEDMVLNMTKAMNLNQDPESKTKTNLVRIIGENLEKSRDTQSFIIRQPIAPDGTRGFHDGNN